MGYDVKLARAIECPTAVVTARTSWDEFPMLWKTLLDDVWAFVRDSALRAGGHNVMLYKDDVPNVEVGVQVTGKHSTPAVGSSPPRCRPARLRRPSTAALTTAFWIGIAR